MTWLLLKWVSLRIYLYFLDLQSKWGYTPINVASDERPNSESKKPHHQICRSPKFTASVPYWQSLWCLSTPSHFVLLTLKQTPWKTKASESIRETGRNATPGWFWLPSEAEIAVRKKCSCHLRPFMDISFWSLSQCRLRASIPIAADCQLTSLSLMITDLSIISRWTHSLSLSIFLSFCVLIFSLRVKPKQTWTLSDFSTLLLFSIHSFIHWICEESQLRSRQERDCNKG